MAVQKQRAKAARGWTMDTPTDLLALSPKSWRPTIASRSSASSSPAGWRQSSEFVPDSARHRLQAAKRGHRIATGARQKPSSGTTVWPTPSALRPYVGRWVGVRQGRVLIADTTARDVVASLRARGLTADAVFRVPTDPTRDAVGFQ